MIISVFDTARLSLTYLRRVLFLVSVIQRQVHRQPAQHKQPADQAGKAPQLIFNDYLDAGLTALFIAVSWILAVETLRVCLAIVAKRPHPPSSESAHIPSRLVEDWVRD